MTRARPYNAASLRQQYATQPPPLDYDLPTDFWGSVKEVAREEARAVSPQIVKGSLVGGLGSDQRVTFQRNSALAADTKKYPMAASFYPATSGADVWGLQRPEGGGVVVLGPEKNTVDKDMTDMVHRDGSQAMTGRLALSGSPLFPNDASTKAYTDTKIPDSAAAVSNSNLATNSVTTSKIGTGEVTDAKLASNYALTSHTHAYAATNHSHGGHTHTLPSSAGGGVTGSTVVS